MFEDSRHLLRHYLWKWVWGPLSRTLCGALTRPLQETCNGVWKLWAAQVETNRLLRIIVREQEQAGEAEIEQIENRIEVLRQRIAQEEAIGKFPRMGCDCGVGMARFDRCVRCLRNERRELQRRRRELMAGEARLVKSEETSGGGEASV